MKIVPEPAIISGGFRHLESEQPRERGQNFSETPRSGFGKNKAA
jgi:hypothetical protein